MKYANPIVLMGALIWVAGCASPTQVTVLEPSDPAPGNYGQSKGEGFLRVSSARQSASVDVNMEEWRWNNDFGKNDFLYESAHTDYSLYSGHGQFLERLRNARSPSDNSPALISLPAGSYEIEAEVEDNGGAVAARVPVVIQPGQTTTVHLAGGWKPRRHYTDNQVVRLPDGQIAGWRALR